MSDASKAPKRPLPKLTLTALEWKLYLASAMALMFTVSWFAVRQPAATVTDEAAVALEAPVPAMPIDPTLVPAPRPPPMRVAVPSPARAAAAAPLSRTLRVAQGPRVTRIRTRSS